ncbi:Uncharacterized protein TCM_034621 [Theobroma cacao]|uniref:Uncharacterized protein n=1 Tax=Theobroma cacao TaxID=3641 RepID=A0A061FFY2_THECC|nr:Uncharacterized protein TCM_034621 [Theobroma cacao]
MFGVCCVFAKFNIYRGLVRDKRVNYGFFFLFFTVVQWRKQNEKGADTYCNLNATFKKKILLFQSWFLVQRFCASSPCRLS